MLGGGRPQAVELGHIGGATFVPARLGPARDRTPARTPHATWQPPSARGDPARGREATRPIPATMAVAVRRRPSRPAPIPLTADPAHLVFARAGDRNRCPFCRNAVRDT